MPKMKTNRGAAKRFRATKNGFKHRRTNRGHGFTYKTRKRKRNLVASGSVHENDAKSVKRLLKVE